MLYRLKSLHVASDGTRYPAGSYIHLDEGEARELGAKAVPVGEADAGVRRLRDRLKEGLVDQGEEAGFGALAFRDPARGLILIPDESFQEAIGDRDSDEVLGELASQRYFPVRNDGTPDTWGTWWIGGMRVSGWVVRASILHKRGPSPEA